MTQTRTRGHWTVRSLMALAALGLVTVGAACGDDDSGSSKKPPPRKARKRSNAATAAKGTAQFSYAKVDDDLRRKLGEIDFIPDPTGETNRDPFRSWVLKPANQDGADTVEIVDPCTQGKVRWGAESYSVRDLSLIGLVKRSQSYAQFTDASERDSWIVRKGDCIGQEKAIIEEIGVGYVRLSITPPAPPGAPAPPAQKQEISLHPNELEIPDSVIATDGAEKP